MLNNRLRVTILALLVVITSCKDEEKVITPGTGLIARAGADQQVKLGDTVTLDGSGSTEGKNKPFDYSWELIKKPLGSAAILTSANTLKTTFVPDEEGDYEVELTTSNADGKSTDKVLITASPAEPITLDADIKAKTVLINRISNPNFPDYVVTKNLGVSAELSINPGVVIAFARDTRFTVNENGSLIAKGQADKKIRFEGREKVKGFWGGISINSPSSSNAMEYVEVTHAGAQAFTRDIKGGMALKGGPKAMMSIKNCIFSLNEGYGLYVEEQASLPGFASNVFKENTGAGILVDVNNVKSLDGNSQFTGGNGQNVVRVYSDKLDGNSGSEVQWAVLKDKTPYRFTESITVAGGWKVLPGTIFEFERDVSLRIEGGYMSAGGTKENKITFRGAEALKGYWRGIIFTSSSSKNTIEYADISGGGSIQIVSGMKANVAIHGTNARMDVKNSTISSSGGYGIYASYMTIVNGDLETSNTFRDNAEGTYYRQK